MRTHSLAIPFLALLLTAPALADEGELTKAEQTALKVIEKEQLKLAKFAAKGKDFAAAKTELKLGLEVCPDAKSLTKELEKVEKKADKNKKEPKDSFPAKLAEKRAEAHETVSLALADAALATEQEHPGRYQRYLKLIRTHFPSKAALDRLDLVYFAPYLKWVSKSEAATLEEGGELLDGKWLDATAVEALNQQHQDWSNPWILTDEVHEVRTTITLRKARRILAYVGAYRRYFLARFSETWDLRPPTGKLPLIVTRTQAELKGRLKAIASSLGGQVPTTSIPGAAYYMHTNGKLNPCFVTYEPTDATGTTMQIQNFKELQVPLSHEVTHQIVFEYSKHDYDATRGMPAHFWSVEAIANFMCYHVFDGTTWKLSHPRTIAMGGGMIEGPFAWCVNNKGSLPALKGFMAQNQQQFSTVTNYHVAATLAYFLLHGKGGKYRASFVQLLQAVHKIKAQADSFEKAFPGVSYGTLQKEFAEFVGQIQLD